MREKWKSQAHLPEKWDESQLRAALAAARCHAARFARQRRLTREDREDLAQDILVAILEASPRFDVTRASWATYIAVLARRAVIDRARQPAPPACVSLDSPAGADLRDALVAPQADPDMAVAFGRAAADLPAQPQALLHRIITHRDVIAARDASTSSPATFYRELRDLRCWLRALGVRPPAATRRHSTAPAPSAP